MENILFQIRVTGILIEDGKILLFRQQVSPEREWSLPGGRLERGETLEQGVTREIREETGLETIVKRLLYVCDKPDAKPPLIHITFLLERTGGVLRLPDNHLDANPIHDVRMVSIGDLSRYGFSERFTELVRVGFPEAGSYRGLKSSIGL